MPRVSKKKSKKEQEAEEETAWLAKERKKLAKARKEKRLTKEQEEEEERYWKAKAAKQDEIKKRGYKERKKLVKNIEKQSEPYDVEPPTNKEFKKMSAEVEKRAQQARLARSAADPVQVPEEAPPVAPVRRRITPTVVSKPPAPAPPPPRPRSPETPRYTTVDYYTVNSVSVPRPRPHPKGSPPKLNPSKCAGTVVHVKAHDRCIKKKK